VGYIRRSDFIGEMTEVSYEMNEPKKWIRNYRLMVFQEAEWSFGGENTGNHAGAALILRNNKLWSFSLSSTYNFSILDTRELRGGPALRNDPRYLLGITVESNATKDLSGKVNYSYMTMGMPNSFQNSLILSLTWVPIKRLKLSGIANQSKRQYHQQYVSSIAGSSST